MTDSRFTPAPTRLAQTTDELSSLFSQTEAEFRSNVDEDRAWKRLVGAVGTSKPASASPTRGLVWLWPAVAAAVLVVGWFGWSQHRPRITATHTMPSSVVRPQSQEPREQVIQLASGRNQLPDGTVAELKEGAGGTYVANARETTLSFDSGQLEIAVAHQREGHQFAVKAKGHSFVVLGTRFTVKIHREDLELAVAEGRVAVRNEGVTLAVVEKGGHWSNAHSDAGLAVPAQSTLALSRVGTGDKSAAPTESAVDPSNPARCQGLLREGKSKEAERCYLDIAAGSGLSAEMALYEVARLRRDVLSNPSAALSTLDEYELRFASGTLAPEAKMAKIDLLARLGRGDEALRASDALLANPIGQARVVELRLLRGNLLRDKRDCAAAEREYRLIEARPGPRGDQAQFARAACLEALGQTEAAIAAYRRYLERPGAMQAARAQQRLSEISQ